MADDRREPLFDSVDAALNRADYIGTDPTGNPEWDADIQAVAVLAAEVRRLTDAG